MTERERHTKRIRQRLREYRSAAHLAKIKPMLEKHQAEQVNEKWQAWEKYYIDLHYDTYNGGILEPKAERPPGEPPHPQLNAIAKVKPKIEAHNRRLF
jgi:hypothetical protein